MHNKELVTGVLCNPASGRIRRSMDEIRSILSSVPVAVYCEAINTGEIYNAIESCAEKQVNLLVLIGGDGTVHTSLSQLFRIWVGKKPVVAVIPGGTTNMTAFDLGMKKSPQKCLSLLLAALSNPGSLKYTSRAVLQIEHGDEFLVSGMFFGCGLVPQGVKYFHKTIGKAGVASELTGGLVMLKYVASLLFRPGKQPVTRLTIMHNGEKTDYDNCLAAFITTLDRLLLGIRPYRHVDRDRLSFTIINNNIKSVWTSVFYLLAGKGTRHPGEYIDSNSNNLGLLIDGNIMVDGELYNASRKNGPVTISRTGPIEFLVL